MCFSHRAPSPDEEDVSLVRANKKFLEPVVKQFPSSLEKQGDSKLDKARKLLNEFETVLPDSDRRVFEELVIW